MEKINRPGHDQPMKTAIILTVLSAFLLTAAYGLVDGKAHANNACPRNWSEKESLVLERRNPKLVTRFSRRNGRLIEDQTKMDFGRETKVRNLYHHPLLPADIEQNDRKVTIAFDDPVSDIDQLPEKKRWLSEMTTKINGEIAAERVVISLSYGGKVPLLVGKCRYETWKIRMSQDFGSKGILFKTLNYAPSLGIAIRDLRTNQKGNTLGGVQYDSIKLEPLSKN
ncbi:hypothetical protein SAMN06265368_0381 [Cohaesibacter gelatinilyticus]|uniref:Uncharacterized protein n=2 Tax=Cohaesibacter gelatinilyticus TaxID=372072 RepID=A0A285NBM4_9HYPH|nr:hypothetical protein SAMN06265368_0381 [Cohaesibacter gelatinilyticus]